MVLLRASVQETVLADHQCHATLVLLDPGAPLRLRLRHPPPSICTAFDVSYEKAEMLREEVKEEGNGKLALTQEGEELGDKVNPTPETENKKNGMSGKMSGMGRESQLREELDELRPSKKKRLPRGQEEEAPVLDERKKEKAEVQAVLKGEGQQPPAVVSEEVAQQEEADAMQKQEDAGEGFEPPDKEERKMAALPPEARIQDFYTFTSARLSQRSRQAALIADNAVMEAWRQQQYARYWSRQAQELEQAALKALRSCKPKAGEDASSRVQQLPVPPGWELPPTPLVSTKDSRAVNIYSLSVGPAGLLFGSGYPSWCGNQNENSRKLVQRQTSSFL